ncbi:P-loop containing nucleoside triphosphate hydrolase protein, partial [Mycena vulgaris]
MLPARPKIFHGRDSEVAHILDNLNHHAPRIAILGGGGMGKTSVARAVLHHSDIVAKYELRLFVPCDSATTSTELVILVGSYIGLKSGRHLQRLVVDHFSRRTSSLLILDNLETLWDVIQSRREVEEFLSLLTGVQHLALIITMRGAERPAKVRWTHPFLPPLQPLTDEAARQTFLDIADDFHNPNEVTQVLQLTDNMPLAVDLIAHLVDYEGCTNVLIRWGTEKTALLSQGYDRRSNLNASITMSLSSPRITSLPGAKDLLSLLSILPDGLSDVQVFQSRFPIEDILACKSALLGTGLAYNNINRLKVLVPIREYIRLLYPPLGPLVKPLQDRFHSL